MAGTAALPNRLVTGRVTPREKTPPFRRSHRRLAHSAESVPRTVLAIRFSGTAEVFTSLPLYFLNIDSEPAGIAIANFSFAIAAVRLLSRQLPARY